jgi:hypothetical protein
MTPRPRLRALALAALALLGAAPALAQSKTGTTLGTFLLIEPSARFTALGNAGVATDALLEGAYYNPAAVGRAKKFEIAFSHADWLADIRYDYVAAALPVGKWGTSFASITSLNSGDIDVRTVGLPLGTGETYTVSNLAIGLGHALEITDRFTAGIQVRWLQESIWNSSAQAVTFDVGTIYRIAANGLHIGSSLTNFGTSGSFSGRDLRITYDEDPDREGDNSALPGERYTNDYPTPVMFRLGLGYPVRFSSDVRGWFAVAGTHPSDNSESVSGGAELTFYDMASARIGWQSLFEEDTEEGLTAGVGWTGRLSDSFDYRIDYGWADYGRLESVHRVTLGLSY